MFRARGQSRERTRFPAMTPAREINPQSWQMRVAYCLRANSCGRARQKGGAMAGMAVGGELGKQGRRADAICAGGRAGRSFLWTTSTDDRVRQRLADGSPLGRGNVSHVVVVPSVSGQRSAGETASKAQLSFGNRFEARDGETAQNSTAERREPCS